MRIKSLVLLWCFSFTWCGASARWATSVSRWLPRQDAQSSRSQILPLHEQHIDSSEWWHLNFSVGWIRSHEHLIFDIIDSTCHPKVGRTILFSFISSCIRKLRLPKVLKFFIFIHSSFILWFLPDLIVQDHRSSCCFHHLESVHLVCEIGDFALGWVIGTLFFAERSWLVLKSPRNFKWLLSWMLPTEVRPFGPRMGAVPWQWVIRWQTFLHVRFFWVNNFAGRSSSWFFHIFPT